MAHSMPPMLFTQAGEPTTLVETVKRRVLLTLEETQGHYTLQLEQHTQGISSPITRGTDDFWSCYVVAGAFLFARSESDTDEGSFVAHPGDVVALPIKNTHFAYQLVDTAHAGQLLIVSTPSSNPNTDVRHVRSGEGRSLTVFTDIGTFKLVGDDTQQAYIMMEWHVPPQGGVAVHAQSSEETFFILQGSFAFRGVHEGQEYTHYASPGDVIHAQKYVPHSYQNVGGLPGTMLVVMAPAGSTQQFFEEVGRLTDSSASSGASPLDALALMELLQKYHVTIFPSSP